MRALPLTCLLMLAAAPAWAQDDAGTTTDDTSGSLEVTNDDVALDNCLERRSEQVDYSASVPGNTGNDEMRVLYEVRQDGVDPECDDTPESCVQDTPCGCLATKTDDSLTDGDGTVRLNDLIPDLCDALDTYEIRFTLQRKQVDGDTTGDWEVPSGSEATDEIIVDLEAPGTPTNTPVVTANDEKLSVDLISAPPSGSEWDVCFIRQGSGAEPPEDCPEATIGESTLSARRGLGTNSANCEQTTRSEVEFTGLDNNATYWVFYGELDQVGNRSCNSPVAEGSPVNSLDFAEYYTLRGGGEKGGCDAGSATRTSVPVVLCGLVVLVAGLRRRRNR